MPKTLTRFSIVVCLNSLIIDASDISPDILKSLVQFLNKDIIVMIPLYGSISASGDMTPLSYIPV